jgi:hypothetical protein
VKHNFPRQERKGRAPSPAAPEEGRTSNDAGVEIARERCARLLLVAIVDVVRDRRSMPT